MVEFTNKIIHVPGHLNIVADLMFRPPQAVPAPGAAMAASVKAPSGSLAVSQVAGGTAGAFSLLGAVVAAAENVDLEQLAAAQTHCPSIAQLQHIPVKSTPEGQQLWLCDTSSCWWQPLVPLHWQKKVFLAVQSFAHPGIRASGQLLSSRIVWRGMATNIGSWCWECTACQRAKVTTQPTSPI